MEVRLSCLPRLLGQSQEDQRHLRLPRLMAVRRNPDGSITVGILKEEPKEKPEVKAEKPKRTAKPKTKGEG